MTDFTRTVFSIQVVLFVLMIQSCCPKESHADPPYPAEVSGWRERAGNGFTILGDFVLKKGEATDNGQFQVRVEEIIPPDPCAEVGTFQRQARARIQFVRLADDRVLCEDIYPERGGSSFSPQDCGSEPSDVSALSNAGLLSLYVTAINLEQQWVFFELRG